MRTSTLLILCFLFLWQVHGDDHDEDCCKLEEHALSSCATKACTSPDQIDMTDSMEFAKCYLENCAAELDTLGSCEDVNCPEEPCVDKDMCADYTVDNCDNYVNGENFVYKMCPVLCNKCEDNPCSGHCQTQQTAFETCVSTNNCDPDSDATCLMENCSTQTLDYEECKHNHCNEEINTGNNCTPEYEKYAECSYKNNDCYTQNSDSAAAIENCMEDSCGIEESAMTMCGWGIYSKMTNDGQTVPNHVCGVNWGDQEQVEIAITGELTMETCVQGCSAKGEEDDENYGGASIIDGKCICVTGCDCLMPMYGATSYVREGVDSRCYDLSEAACCEKQDKALSDCFFLQCTDVAEYPDPTATNSKVCMVEKCETEYAAQLECERAVDCPDEDGGYKSFVCGDAWEMNGRCTGTMEQLDDSYSANSCASKCEYAFGWDDKPKNACCEYTPGEAGADGQCAVSRQSSVEMSDTINSQVMVCGQTECGACMSQESQGIICVAKAGVTCAMDDMACYNEHCPTELRAYLDCEGQNCDNDHLENCSCTGQQVYGVHACLARNCVGLVEDTLEYNECLWNTCEADTTVSMNCLLGDTGCSEDSDCTACATQLIAMQVCIYSDATKNDCADDMGCRHTTCHFEIQAYKTCRGENGCEHKSTEADNYDDHHHNACYGSEDQEGAGVGTFSEMDDCVAECNTQLNGMFSVVEWLKDTSCRCLQKEDCPCLDDVDDEISYSDAIVGQWKDEGDDDLSECSDECEPCEGKYDTYTDCGIEKCYDSSKPDEYQSNTQAFRECAMEQCWAEFMDSKTCVETNCSWLKFWEDSECANDVCATEEAAVTSCRATSTCGTEYADLVTCTTTTNDCVQEECSECGVASDKFKYCTVSECDGSNDTHCMTEKCMDQLVNALDCAGDHPDACDMNNDETYCPPCSGAEAALSGCGLICIFGSSNPSACIADCTPLTSKQMVCQIQNHCKKQCYELYDDSSCGSSSGEVAVFAADECTELSVVHSSFGEGYYQWKDNEVFQDGECDGNSEDLFSDDFDTPMNEEDQCYTLNEEISTNGMMSTECPDNVICSACTDKEIAMTECSLTAYQNCQGEANSNSCIITACTGVSLEWARCKQENNCHETEKDDDKCVCKQSWSDSDCSNPNEVFEGCPDTPCDGDDKLWCVLENPGCDNDENDEGWAYCGADEKQPCTECDAEQQKMQDCMVNTLHEGGACQGKSMEEGANGEESEWNQCAMSHCAEDVALVSACHVEKCSDEVADCPNCAAHVTSFYDCYGTAMTSEDCKDLSDVENAGGVSDKAMCVMTTCGQDYISYNECRTTEDCLDDEEKGTIWCAACWDKFLEVEQCKLDSYKSGGACENSMFEDCGDDECFHLMVVYNDCSYTNNCASACPTCDTQSAATWACGVLHSKEGAECHGLDNHVSKPEWNDETEMVNCLIGKCSSEYGGMTSCQQDNGCNCTENCLDCDGPGSEDCGTCADGYDKVDGDNDGFGECVMKACDLGTQLKADCTCGQATCATGLYCLGSGDCTAYLGEWKTEASGACDKTCDGGQQTVEHSCVSKVDANAYPDYMCDAGLKPTNTAQACNTDVVCEYEYVVTDGACSSSCRDGTIPKTATCVLKGTTMEMDGMCASLPEPDLTPVACNENVPCAAMKSKAGYDNIDLAGFNSKQAQFKSAWALASNTDNNLISLGSVEAKLRRRLTDGVVATWVTDLDTLTPQQQTDLIATVTSDTFTDTLATKTSEEAGVTVTVTEVVDETEYVAVGDFTDIACTSTCTGGTQTTTVLTCVIKGSQTLVDQSNCSETEVTQNCNADVACSTAAPVTEAPVTEAPVTDAPVTDAPVTDAPVTDAPVTDEPVTDEPVTDEPVTDAPATDAPATDAPAAETTTAADTGIDDGASQLCLLALIFVLSMMF